MPTRRLGVLSALLYRLLPHAQIEATRSAPLGPSRGMVYKLAALFSLDAFAGGFVVQSLLALWLFERFDLSLSAAGVFFFWAARSSAFSYPVAAWLAPLRPGQHHGVHPHPVQHVAHPGGVLVQSLCDARPAVAALGAVANGRADAHLLRHGGGDAAGARRGGELHRGAAQPRLGDQPGLRRRAVDHGVHRLAAGRLRRAEDRLRRGAAVSRSGTSSRRRKRPRRNWNSQNGEPP